MDLLRHLRYFAVVAEEGHIGRAAERLNLAQPALSQRVKALELALGIALVVKDGRGIRITEKGRVLGLRAASLVEAADRIGEDLRSGRAPQVVIAVPATVSPARLASMSGDIGACVAPRDASVVPMSPREREHTFETSSVDAALLGSPAEGDFSLRLGVALADDHPLAGMASVHPSDLNEERLLVLDEDSVRRPFLEAHLDRLGLDAEWIEWDLEPVAALARVWSGAVCLTDSCHAMDAGLRWIPLGGTELRRQFELRWRSDSVQDAQSVARVLATAMEGRVENQFVTANRSPAGTLARIRDVWAGVGVTGSLHVRALDTGRDFGIRADDSWPIASVAKVPLVVAMHRGAARGWFDLAQSVVLRPDGRTRGTTGVSAMADPVKLSLRDAAYLALTISDNAASDAIWDVLGRDRVQALLREVIEPDEMWLGEPLRDLYDRVEFGNGDVDAGTVSRATAAGLTHLLDLIWSDRASTSEACAHIRELMGRQVWGDRLASGFPAVDVTVAGKTGTVRDHCHEIGVVTYPDGTRYAVAILTKLSTKSAHHRWEWAIGETARLAVNAVRRGERH